MKIKTLNKQNKDIILKTAREKDQESYKGRLMRITPDFSTETLKARRAWRDALNILRDYRSQPRLLYSEKLSILGKPKYSTTKSNLIFTNVVLH